jgi:hypothetical protein
MCASLTHLWNDFFSYPVAPVRRGPTMFSTPALEVSATAVAVSAIWGGAMAGSLHTVTGRSTPGVWNCLPSRSSILKAPSRLAGPDHLAALLPRCVGERWFQALQTGATWGLGESHYASCERPLG